MLQMREPREHTASRSEVHPAAQVHGALLPDGGDVVGAAGAFDADARHADTGEVKLGSHRMVQQRHTIRNSK